MRKTLFVYFTFSIFLISVRIFAQTNQEMIITDPSVTSRCKAMLEKRQDLLNVKQKLIALRKRNDNLLKKTPAEKKSIIEKSIKAGKMLAREAELNQLKLQNTEEEIIKNGCPGISR